MTQPNESNPGELRPIEDAQPDASQDDALVEQTDNGPEDGAQEPPQGPDDVADDDAELDAGEDADGDGAQPIPATENGAEAAGDESGSAA